MILTIVPNPSLDRTAVVPGFETGRTFRVGDVLGLAGGKGLNAARAMRTLGLTPLVVGPFGGHIGRMLVERAAAEGLSCDAVAIQGETRTCLTIVDPEAGRITELYERGPRLAPGDWDRVVEKVVSHLPHATWMVLSGSSPPETPDDGLKQLVARASSAGVPVLLDTYGPWLAGALGLGPALLKINQDEAAGLVGHAVDTAASATAAAGELRRRGAQAVVITLGKQGALCVDRDGAPFGWSAPRVPGTFPIGSGDSLFGGIVAGLSRKQSLREALRLGVAVGAANTLRMGPGVFDAAQVERLLPEVAPLAL